MAEAVTACARLIQEAMDRRDISQAELGRRLNHSGNGLVQAVLAGKRGLPLDALEEWIAALELVGDDARMFRRIALRTYGAPYVQELLDTIDRLKTKVEDGERDDAP